MCCPLASNSIHALHSICWLVPFLLLFILYFFKKKKHSNSFLFFTLWIKAGFWVMLLYQDDVTRGGHSLPGPSHHPYLCQITYFPPLDRSFYNWTALIDFTSKPLFYLLSCFPSKSKSYVAYPASRLRSYPNVACGQATTLLQKYCSRTENIIMTPQFATYFTTESCDHMLIINNLVQHIWKWNSPTHHRLAIRWSNVRNLCRTRGHTAFVRLHKPFANQFASLKFSQTTNK